MPIKQANEAGSNKGLSLEVNFEISLKSDLMLIDQ